MTMVEEAAKIAAKLDADRKATKALTDVLAQAKAYRDTVFADMEALRAPIDRLEKLLPRDYWPMPTYEELLFRM
jgi:glutamine synthetase